VICELQLPVQVNPGSNVKYPVLAYRFLISIIGGPRLPFKIGSYIETPPGNVNVANSLD